MDYYEEGAGAKERRGLFAGCSPLVIAGIAILGFIVVCAVVLGLIPVYLRGNETATVAPETSTASSVAAAVTTTAAATATTDATTSTDSSATTTTQAGTSTPGSIDATAEAEVASFSVPASSARLLGRAGDEYLGEGNNDTSITDAFKEECDVQPFRTVVQKSKTKLSFSRVKSGNYISVTVTVTITLFSAEIYCSPDDVNTEIESASAGFAARIPTLIAGAFVTKTYSATTSLLKFTGKCYKRGSGKMKDYACYLQKGVALVPSCETDTDVDESGGSTTDQSVTSPSSDSASSDSPSSQGSTDSQSTGDQTEPLPTVGQTGEQTDAPGTTDASASNSTDSVGSTSQGADSTSGAVPTNPDGPSNATVSDVPPTEGGNSTHSDETTESPANGNSTISNGQELTSPPNANETTTGGDVTSLPVGGENSTTSEAQTSMETTSTTTVTTTTVEALYIGKYTQKAGETCYVRALAWYSYGLLVRACNQQISLWSLATGTIQTTNFKGTSNSLRAVAVLSTGELVSGDNTGDIKVWPKDLSPQSPVSIGSAKHGSEITALVGLQDGNFASASLGSNDIMIWSASGAAVKTLTGHNASVTALFVLANGDLASASNNVIVFTATSYAQQPAIELGASLNIKSLSQLTNGLLLAQNANGNLYRVDTASGKLQGKIVTGYPSAHIVATADMAGSFYAAVDKTVHVWHDERNYDLFIDSMQTTPVTAIVVLPVPGRSTVYVTGAENGQLIAVDASSLAAAAPVALVGGFADGGVVDEVITALTYTANGEVASGGVDGTITIWNVNDGTKKYSFKGHDDTINAMALTENAEFITGSTDGKVKVWSLDAATGKYNSTPRLVSSHSGTVRCVIDLDFGYYASGGDGSSNKIKIWSILDGKSAGELVGHTATVNDLSLLPNGDLASGSDDKTIIVWDVVAKTKKYSKTLDQKITSLAAPRDNILAAAVFNDLVIFNTSAGDLTFVKRIPGLDSEIGVDVGSDKVLITYDRDVDETEFRVAFVNEPDANRYHSEIKSGEAYSAFVSLPVADFGEIYLVATKGGKLYSVDWSSFKYDLTAVYTGKYARKTESCRARALIWFADDLMARACEQEISLWHKSSGAMKLSFKASTTAINAMCVLSTGVLVSGDSLGSIQLWPKDMTSFTLGTTQTPTKTITHGNQIVALAALKDGKFASSSVNSEEIWIWSSSTGAVVKTLIYDDEDNNGQKIITGVTNALLFHSSGHLVSASKIVLVWDIESTEEANGVYNRIAFVDEIVSDNLVMRSLGDESKQARGLNLEPEVLYNYMSLAEQSNGFVVAQRDTGVIAYFNATGQNSIIQSSDTPGPVWWPLDGHSSIHIASAASDGGRYFTASNNTVHTWFNFGRNESFNDSTQALNVVAIVSPPGYPSVYVSAAEDGQLVAADSDSLPMHGPFIGNYGNNQQRYITIRLAYLSDGFVATSEVDVLAAQSEDNDEIPGYIGVFNVTDGTRKTVFKAHDSLITELAVLKNGELASISPLDGTIKVWTPTANGQLSSTPRLTSNHFTESDDGAYSPCVIGLPDGSYASGGYYENDTLSVKMYTIKVWNITDGSLSYELPNDHTDGISSMVVLTNQQYLASADWDGLIIIWDLATRKQKANISMPVELNENYQSVQSLVMVRDNVLAATFDYKVVLFDTSAGTLVVIRYLHSLQRIGYIGVAVGAGNQMLTFDRLDPDSSFLPNNDRMVAARGTSSSGASGSSSAEDFISFKVSLWNDTDSLQYKSIGCTPEGLITTLTNNQLNNLNFQFDMLPSPSPNYTYMYLLSHADMFGVHLKSVDYSAEHDFKPDPILFGAYDFNVAENCLLKKIVWYADGLVARACSDEISTWHISTGTKRTSFWRDQDNGEFYTAMCVLPTGELVTGDSEGRIGVWPKDLSKFSGYQHEPNGDQYHGASITALATLKDGYYASAGEDSLEILIWSPTSTTSVKTLLGHDAPINDLIVLRNGDLVSASNYLLGWSAGYANLAQSKNMSADATTNRFTSITELSNGNLAAYDYNNFGLFRFDYSTQSIAGSPIQMYSPFSPEIFVSSSEGVFHLAVDGNVLTVANEANNLYTMQIDDSQGFLEKVTSVLPINGTTTYISGDFCGSMIAVNYSTISVYNEPDR